MLKFLFTTCALICLLASPLTAADDAPPVAAGRKYDLKYQYKPGEIVKTEVVHQATVATTIQGTTQTAETRTTSIKVWKIVDVTAAGGISFEHSVEAIDMWQQMKGRQEVKYNSRTDATPPPGYEDVAKVVGVILTTATIDPRGKVVKRVDNRPSADSNSTPLAIVLPDGPVAIGHVWTNPSEVEVKQKSGGTSKIQMRHHYTLEKVVDNEATIKVDTQVLTPVRDPSIEAQLIQRMSNGTIRFDLVKGRIVGQQLDLDRRVIGFSGPSSSMHYLSRFTEDLQPAAETARRTR